MTVRSSSKPQYDNDQGMVLIAVLLLLMAMSALAATLAVSSNTETLVARNHQTAAEARAAAEAGLSHGTQIVIATLQNWQANGFPSAALAVTDLLIGPDNTAGNADDGSLAGVGGGAGIPAAGLALGALPDIRYQARILDDDDPARGFTLDVPDAATALARVGENGLATTDANRRLIVRATGYAGGGAVATIEATIAPVGGDDRFFGASGWRRVQ